MEGECSALDQSQTREAVCQAVERELRLKFAQRGAQAIVNALAKGEGLGRVRAAQIERLGLRKDGGVAAGGGEPEEELGAWRQVNSPQRNGMLGHAPPHGDGGVVTQG